MHTILYDIINNVTCFNVLYDCIYLVYKKKTINVGNKDSRVKIVECCVRLSWCTEESENFGLHKTIKQIVLI